MVLADLGADVVKIEDPRLGDYLRALPPAKGGMSGRFLAVNRGKRSCALDLKEARGRDALLAMAERANVVVESFRPGVMDKLGVGWEALRARNPALVMCSISGYGATGPYRDRAGHDLNYIAVGGVLAMGGGVASGAPGMPGVQIADLAGGALWAATAILAQLVSKTGAHLDISMTEGAMALLAAELGNIEMGSHPSRGTEGLNGGLACYGVYQTSDGRFLSVGALEPKFWAALNTALGRKIDMAELVAGPDVQARVRSELANIFKTKTAAEWSAQLAPHDCCVELVVEPEELHSHPLHTARGVFFDLDAGPGIGVIKQLRTPVGAPDSPRAPPKLGEHTAEVLAEYGVSL